MKVDTMIEDYQRLCDCRNGSSITTGFRVISIPKYCILVCLKNILMRRRALCRNIDPFTSNYAVISLSDFPRDVMRELKFCLSLSFLGLRVLYLYVCFKIKIVMTILT